ncbi:hemoglobin [Alteromonadaceae bacterium 2753L.S.0a.02]|nr:hemoglobin [Alteromonadaceae bacterium 2753L.S.0a.02]
MSSVELPQYGSGDATYQALGGLEGITRLVNRFYDNMDSLPEARALRDMHAEDLSQSRQKLVYFLSGWMGGPKLFAEHYGSISLPVAHAHLPIDMAGKDSWLHCMEVSLKELEFPEDLRNYLMKKFAVPAESIRLMCEHSPRK